MDSKVWGTAITANSKLIFALFECPNCKGNIKITAFNKPSDIICETCQVKFYFEPDVEWYENEES